MLEEKKKKILIYGIPSVSLLFIFLIWGFAKFVEKTSEPNFCNSCHVMNYEFEAWFMTGLHRNIKCVDCHLPNNNTANHLLWKGIDGMKDFIMFHTSIFSEPITITSHGKKTIQSNCISCHEGMLTMIEIEGRNCWSCHRRTTHKIMNFAQQK